MYSSATTGCSLPCVLYFSRKPNLSGNSPCKGSWKRTNYYTAIAFRQPVSSLALQAETLQLVANTSPREWQFYVALQHFLFFLKKSVYKSDQGKSVPLAYCHKFSAPSASLNRRSLLSGFKNKGLCWSWLHLLLHSSCCLPYTRLGCSITYWLQQLQHREPSQ